MNKWPWTYSYHLTFQTFLTFLINKTWMNVSLSAGRVSASGRGVYVLQRLVHKWEEDEEEEDWLVDECSVCSDAVALPACRGDKELNRKAEPKWVSSVNLEDLGVERRAHHIETSQLRWLRHLWDSSLERRYRYVPHWGPAGWAAGGAVARRVSVSAETAAPAARPRIKPQKVDGCLGKMCFITYCLSL